MANKLKYGWYVLYDGNPVAGPFKTEDQACKIVSRMTVEWLENDNHKA